LARASSIRTPLILVRSSQTKTGDTSVTSCQASSAGAAITAMPIHRTISPK